MCQAVDDRVEEMASLVADKLDWPLELALDVLVKEFGCRGCRIILERLVLYPLCTVVGGDEDILVACACYGWGKQTYEIQPPFLERFQRYHRLVRHACLFHELA